mgnify:FL=1
MEDIDIARKANKEKINIIADKINIPDEFVENYGKFKAKVNANLYNELEKKENGKLILVTSINPTPLGEGKTTVSIGLADSLNKLNKNAILALREPSLGPVFGIKGGATGGGMAQVVPMEDINLHFTGDIHAITSANNLLSAMIDNHIYYGNELKFKKVIWKRCVDLNDRSLRKVEIGLSNEKNMKPREDSFDISVASEVMAILCLSKDLKDLERRIGNIIVGYDETDNPITAKMLKAEGAMTVLLKDAFNPNLVQTLENNPAFIHGGPFANIAHGCNSIIATKLALKLGDYVITEAGFGSDLGAEKFINIKCRTASIKPNAVICVATIKALKYHGGMPISEIETESTDYLKRGMKNLFKHIENLKDKFGLNVIVAINKFKTDTEAEIELITSELKKVGVDISLVEVWGKGSLGGIDLAEKVIELCEKENEMKFTYDVNDSIKEKILKVAKNIYGAANVEYSEEANESIKMIEKIGKDRLPICIAKTQYSFSDDAKNLECLTPFTIKIDEVNLKNGAEFIVAKAGKIFTMPGLPRVPSAEKIRLDENNQIVGIF